jgi:hypothetical protein
MVEWSGKWMAFTLDHKDAKAIDRFREVHGREPESVIRDENARLLLVGPVKTQTEIYPHLNILPSPPTPLPKRERGGREEKRR